MQRIFCVRLGVFLISFLFLSTNSYPVSYEYDSAYSDDNYYDTYNSYNSYSEGQRYSSYDYADNEDYSYTPKPHHSRKHKHKHLSEEQTSSHKGNKYLSRLPQQIERGEDVIIVDPHRHAWGAYSADGKLLRAGLATAGSGWCSDLGRPCRTRPGTFRIYTLGSSDCISHKFPLPRGGAPMPYCMFFNGHQGIHGSHEVADANLSHGCVRITVSDAYWLRFNFAHIGTKVVVKSY